MLELSKINCDCNLIIFLLKLCRMTMLLLSEQLWTFVSKSSRLMGLGRLGLGLLPLFLSFFFGVTFFNGCGCGGVLS